MKKSTKGFLFGSIIAAGLTAGIYYAKKKGYLDPAIDYAKEIIKSRSNHQPDEEDVFEAEAVSNAEAFTEDNSNSDSDSIADEDDFAEEPVITDSADSDFDAPVGDRTYVSLDFSDSKEKDNTDSDDNTAVDSDVADATDDSDSDTKTGSKAKA